MPTQIHGSRTPEPLTVEQFRKMRKPKNKYGNKKVTTDGHTFDSKKEFNRYCELKLMEKAGQVANIDHHKTFSIDINNKHICNYIADFVYDRINKQGQIEEIIVEDVKSKITRVNPVYRLKFKLMAAVLNINIVEV